MLFLSTLAQHARNHPDKVALEFLADPPSRVSYGELVAQLEQYARVLLSLGVSSGDRVAIQLPKGLDFILFHLAAMRLGCISLPLNPAFPGPELDYFLRDAEAKVYVGEVNRKPELEDVLTRTAVKPIWRGQAEGELMAGERQLPDWPADPDATALMIYTSGTTGRPKGAELTHGNLTANLEALHKAWAWQADDVLLHVLPIFHTHGLMVALHGAFQAAATAVLMPKFEAERCLTLLASKRFSVFMAVPTIHSRLLAVVDSGYDLSHMRLMTSGSARLPDDVFTAFEQTFNYRLLERYGMSETGMNLSNPYHGERRIGSVGLPLPGVEARVVDPASDELLADGVVGEVQIKGRHVFKAYWQQPEKTAETFTADGWLRTGDLGLREADGYYTLKGRAKDLIISGGFNIYPPEVELVLSGHPAIQACAVIGCASSDWGEQVVAVIEAADSQPEVDAVIAYCREQLAAYKVPKAIFFIDELPRNAMGKIEKARLRKLFCL